MGGSLTPALFGLGKLFFSDYRQLRAEVGLSTYTDTDLIGIFLKSKGFQAERSGRNIGHNQARFTLEARKTANSQSFKARPGKSENWFIAKRHHNTTADVITAATK